MPILSLDGVDAVGKTTTASLLAAAVPIRTTVMPEFSDTALGEALRAAVELNPHFLGGSLLAQSLHFLGDFAETMHRAALRDRATLVLVDRGPLSKLVYQVQVLAAEELRRSSDIVESVLADIPLPDVSVLLVAEEAELRQRALSRGDTPSAADMAFVMRAQNAMIDSSNGPFAPDLVVDSTGLGADEVAEKILGLLRTRIGFI